MNPYIFIVLWTPDVVRSDYMMSDFKTSKNKRAVTKPNFEIQCRWYPWMLKLITRHPKLMESDDYKFEYIVFTKQVTPQMQVLTYEWKYTESESLMLHLLNVYRQSLLSAPKPKKNLWCEKGCSLKATCPLWTNLYDNF